MKNLIILAVVCLPLIAFSQVEQGRSFLSGGIGLNSNSPENPQPGSTKQFTHFDVNAMYGFLFADTWAVGITPSLSTQTQTFTDNTKNHSNSFGIGPFVRKYFLLTEKFYFHLDAAYVFNRQKDFSEASNGNNGPVTKSTSNVIAITPGVSYFITDRVAVQAMIGKLSYSKVKNPSTNSGSKAFDLNFSISSISLGAAVYF
jgi:hypothetical protein